MAFGDKSQWDYLAMALIKAYPALQNASAASTPQDRGKTYFQFAGQPLQADWTSGTDYPAWTRANIVPGDLDGFYRETTSLVASSYSTYISSIAPNGLPLRGRRVLVGMHNFKITRNNKKTSRKQSPPL